MHAWVCDGYTVMHVHVHVCEQLPVSQVPGSLQPWNPGFKGVSQASAQWLQSTATLSIFVEQWVHTVHGTTVDFVWSDGHTVQ